MAIADKLEKLFEYRENISDLIRLKGIDIPENTKLKNIPLYLNQLEKPEKEKGEPEWSENFQNQCVADSLANYIEDRARWTGHVDADGLREIGWTEDDIEYFQANGVDWMAEDDDEYIVSDYEKELYRTNAIRVVSSKTEGAATYTSTLISNNDPKVVEWRNTIKWMPKFTTAVMPATINFRNFREMIGCPTFDFSKTTNASYMFARCDKLRCIPPISFTTGATATWNGEYMFYECAKIKTIPTSLNWEKCNKIAYTFGDCADLLYLPELNLPNITSLNNTFTNCQKLIGISNITTSTKLTNTDSVFAGCRSLLTAPLFDTSNCTSMKNMFSNCQSIYNIPLYNTGKNVIFETFFRNCSNLLSCPPLDFNGGVTTYSNMFTGCEKITNLPETMNFDSCTSVANMCYRCLKLIEVPFKLDFNNTAATPSEGIKSYANCFYGCTSLKKLDIGVFFHTSSNASSGGLFEFCPFIEEINVDDLKGGKGNVLASTDLFRVVKIGGELKGISQSVNLGQMRKLSYNAMMNVINALEDVNGADYVPTLTFGAEALRNLTVDDKLIATNKGWKLA